MSIDKGMFNFQGIMDQFYGYQPGKDDSEGRAIKNSFQANMIQSGFDAESAKDMAMLQSQLAKENMTHAADLEMRNKAVAMNDEFNKGTQSMGQQFEFQDRFAENQTVRDTTKDTTNQAVNFEFQNKMAENQNVRDTTKDSVARADQYEYANQMAENQNLRDITKSTYDRGAEFDYIDKLEDNRNIRSMANIGFQGDEQRKTLASTGTQNRLDLVVKGEQDRYGMMQQGDQQRRIDSNQAEENRQTIGFSDQIEAGKQNRQAARSRSMARSF
jgi:hypothetical protein